MPRRRTPISGVITQHWRRGATLPSTSLIGRHMGSLIAWLLALSLIFLGVMSFGALDSRLSAFIGAGLALAVGGLILAAITSQDAYYEKSYWARFGSTFHGLVTATIALDAGAAALLVWLGVSRAKRSVGFALTGTGLLSLPACLALLGIALVGH
jgi:hypothetical protein